MSQAYKNAGVDIEAGYEAVTRMKSHIARTARKGLMSSIGGFGGLFDLSALGVKEPVLVSGTDGVGTKLNLAFESGRNDTIGIDAVAMCVNDVITQGAAPLFFLDYIATSKVDPAQIEAIIKGVSEGCVQSDAALVGGETAEMPGLYKPGEYDIAGFAVGVVEKSQLITGQNIQAGDVLVGIASSGPHSNGFSLIRSVIADMDINAVYFGDKSLLDVLLEPTKIYVKPILEAIKAVPTIKGMSHITGGGFIENIPRMLPPEAGLGIEINKGSWPIPEVFTFLQKNGNIAEDEIYNIWNMGIGMVLAVAPADAEALIKSLEISGEKAYTIGQVIKGEHKWHS